MDIFDTNVLVGLVPNLKLSQNWLLDTFFPNIVTSDSEFVSIDVDIGIRRMSPFVSPMVEGKLVESRRFQTNTFKPAYIKDLRTPDLRKPLRRAIGERIGGELTGAERAMANLQFEMADQVDMLNRRLEWMAAQILQTGKVLITGEGFEDTLVDFNRDASLTVALAGAAKWGQAGVSPAQSIEDWQTLVLQKSGSAPIDVVFTNTAWKWFIADQRVKDSVWFPRSGDSQIEFGGGKKRGAVFKGMWGNFRLWLYNDWYVDANNVEQPMLPDGTVLLSDEDLMGTRAFGMILDDDFQYQPMPYAPKSWVPKNPAIRHLLMQSSPIVIPNRVNAMLAATVI